MSVYFAERGGLVKIGQSRTPERRAVTLGAHLIKVTPGDFATERGWHDRFAADRVEGEWFSPTDALMAAIDAAPDEPEDDVLTPRQVAARFAVTPETVARWADDGKLPSFRTPGGQRRYRRSDVDTFRSDYEPEAVA